MLSCFIRYQICGRGLALSGLLQKNVVLKRGLEDVIMMTPMGARGLAGSSIRSVEGELPIKKA